MSEFHRMITYLYLYEENQKTRNTGFAKIEKRDSRCLVEIHMKNTGFRPPAVPVYFYVRGAEKIHGVLLGEINLSRGSGDFKEVFDAGRLAGSGFGLSQINGIYIPVSDRTMFVSQWDEQEFMRGSFTTDPPDSSVCKRVDLNAAEAAPQPIGNGSQPGPAFRVISSSSEKKPPCRPQRPGIRNGQERTSLHSGQQETANKELLNQERVLSQEPLTQKKTASPESLVEKEISSHNLRNDMELPLQHSSGDTEAPSHNLQNDMELPLQHSSGDTEAPSHNPLDEEKILSQEPAKAQNIPDQEPPSKNDAPKQNPAAEQDIPPRQNQERASIPPQDLDTLEHKWKYILETLPEMTPFEGGAEVRCVRMELKDLRLLPKYYWYLGNNSFLLHGFFNYRYLILGLTETDEKKRWFIGIPGIFQNPERVMASLFGFPGFRSEKSSQCKTGEFGYWYRYLEN